MAKKVLVISSSLRFQCNSEILADSFLVGAQSAGNSVEKIYLRDKEIAFCKVYLACKQLHKCVIEDDAQTIAEKMKLAEVIVFATPIYYYEMSGQMKTLLDRANSLYPADYAFRDIYLLSAAAEDEPDVDEGAVHGLKGWIACYEKARLAGTVFAGGVDAQGEIKCHTSLQKAYDLGAAIQ